MHKGRMEMHNWIARYVWRQKSSYTIGRVVVKVFSESCRAGPRPAATAEVAGMAGCFATWALLQMILYQCTLL